MTFLVEDGTGLPGANSLATVARADDYNSSVFEAQDWQFLEPEEKRAGLIAATAVVCDALDWPGRRLRPMQPLPFPRTGLRDDEGHVHPSWPPPGEVLDAVCELARVLALRNAAGQGTSTSTATPTGAVKEITVGPIGLVMADPPAGTAAAATPSGAAIPEAVMLRLRRFGAPRAGYGPRTLVRWD